MHEIRNVFRPRAVCRFDSSKTETTNLGDESMRRTIFMVFILLGLSYEAAMAGPHWRSGTSGGEATGREAVRQAGGAGAGHKERAGGGDKTCWTDRELDGTVGKESQQVGVGKSVGGVKRVGRIGSNISGGGTKRPGGCEGEGGVGDG